MQILVSLFNVKIHKTYFVTVSQQKLIPNFMKVIATLKSVFHIL